jgi:hypothetical protein
MIHAVGLLEPNAFSRTFKPGTLIRPGNYILSRRGVACVNGAQNRLRNSVTVLGEAVVICQKGAKLSEGAAARGCAGWRKAGLPLVTIFPPRVSLPSRKPGIAVVAPSYAPCRYRGARGVSEAVSARGPGLHCVPQRVRSGPQDAPNSI